MKPKKLMDFNLPILSGFFLVNKPPGITSSGLVGKIKKMTNAKKIGHTGTLDRFAEGLMILPFGKYTSFAGYFLGMDKSYSATVTFGASTNSGDTEGEVIEKWDEDKVKIFFESNIDSIKKAISDISLTTVQIPPKISALKVGGKRQSDLFREGISFTEKIRTVRIYQLSLEEISANGFTFSVRVSSGTYIRKIVMDLSEKLGLPMHTSGLIRKEIGKIKLEEAMNLEEMERGNFDIKTVENIVDLPVVKVSNEMAENINHGRYINLETIPTVETEFLMKNETKLIAYCTTDFEKKSNEIFSPDKNRDYKYLKVFN